MARPVNFAPDRLAIARQNADGTPSFHGWPDRFGFLESTQAMFNPINNLVYNADGRSVHTVVIDGRVVVDAYRQSFVDEPRLFARVQEIGERLQARTGVSFPRSRWPMS